MNALTLVLGLMLIFTCTFSLSFRKAVLAVPVEQTSSSHAKATQKILNSYEKDRYLRLREKPKPKKEQSIASASTANLKPQDHSKNLECARLNLWPLLEGDKSSHKLLYQTIAQVIRNLYAEKLFPEPKFEYLLLDAVLESAKLELKKNPDFNHFPLEKLALAGKKKLPLQQIYYYMLKGTKPIAKSYPSLLEVVTLEREEASKICIAHASHSLLKALFGERATRSILKELDKEKPTLGKEELKEICFRDANLNTTPEFLDLFNFKPHRMKQTQKIIAQSDQDVCLEKKVFFAS